MHERNNFFFQVLTILVLHLDISVDGTDQNCFGITFVNGYLCPKLIC